MDGIAFYFHLRHVLIKNQPLSNDDAYTFVGWARNGNLKFNVNHAARQPTYKYIPVEIIVIAKYWEEKGITIDHEWLLQNGYNNFCTAPVLNYLIAAEG